MEVIKLTETVSETVLAKELVEQVQAVALSKDLKLSKGNTKVLIDSVFEAIGTNYMEGRTTKIVGFGAFEARKVDSKVYANPQDRTQAVTKDAHIAPKFTVSRALKDAVYESTRQA